MEHEDESGFGARVTGQTVRSARASRACAACRARKQRCIPSPSDTQGACQRCARHAMPCSFETQPIPANQDDPGPSRLAQMIVELQQRVTRHEARIAELEIGEGRTRKHPRMPPRAQMNTTGSELLSPPMNATGDGYQGAIRSLRGHTSPSHSFDYSMQQLELAAPIATLKSLGALAQKQPPSLQAKHDQSHGLAILDPVVRGILTEHEAIHAFDIYFNHCHSWAPVLNGSLQSAASVLRKSDPTLFLAIVSVGARFWTRDLLTRGSDGPIELHPRYFELIQVLDTAISRLLLRPCAADASLHTIQSLLIYLQWMPYDLSTKSTDGTGFQGTYKTRYNEMSTWAVFGLALRYADFMGLEQRALDPFNDDATAGNASSNDMDSMRTWLNMVTYDLNLTLTSGMPVTLNPRPAQAPAYRFCSHHAAQRPGDVRYASMVQLAYRHQVVAGIVKVNVDLDSWERQWLNRIGSSRLQKTQMPFTSVRWYRLTLNSSVLRAFLSPSLQVQADPEIILIWAHEPLATSLAAASQILLSVSPLTFDQISRVNPQDQLTVPGGSFLVEQEARESLHHAVDSTWVSHTFAITFLVLCYVRNAINDDLQVRNYAGSPILQGHFAPSKPRPSSLLSRLARLALEIFGVTEHASTFTSDDDYATIVRNATSLLLYESSEAETAQVADDSSSSLQALFDLKEDPAWDWGISFGDEQATWTPSWNMHS
ncbi:hypothetical protein P154DRAFT_572721 [Amniculicola lignicola CBS 123094]|uniref:Zn(2)-C6 fungal-type domain-containing protein n=1 Tax=Amniculicola lignicola CBS 123094 TaxID=1392246 RepID=A0A6A5WQS8_9PLEO|nr:hypothetical protein P154DRAFT_572721 [Amniculicola lignicola CBS 123094]